MQRPGGRIGRHVSSRCVHRFLDGFGLKWPEMDTARNVISRRHHPRKRMIQYSVTGRFIDGSGFTGYPAFASLSRGMTADATLAFRRFWPQIRAGRLAVDEPLANRVRSGRK